MSDNIKLVECFYTPTQVFTIYDYTKIAYPVNNYICIREIVTPEIRPNFIKIQHQYKQIIDIHAFNAIITTIWLNNQNEYCVGFYQSLQFLTKINSDLVNSVLQQTQKSSPKLQSIRQNSTITISHQLQYSQNNIFLLLSKKGKQATQMQNQLIVLSTKTKRVICKAFIPGTIINFFVKEDQFFTVLFDDTRIIEYQLEENDRAKQSWQNFLVMERKKMKLDLREKGFHCWIKEQLITVSNNEKIIVNIEGKQLQSITDFKKVKKIYPIICGFLAINDNFLRVYKKQLLNYVLKAQFFLPQIGYTQNLALSQQEDVFAFYDSMKMSIQYCNNFQEQIQKSSTVIHSRSLKLNQISFKKQGTVQGYSSNQSMFALSNGSYLSIYSSLTYECYLSAAIFSQEGVSPAFRRKSIKRANTIAVNLDSLEEKARPEQITTLSLHPHKNIVAICLKFKVRFYIILFNQIRHIKDINLPNCKDLSFSPSGQFIYLSIGGKQGAKTYIYRTDDFQLVECISVGRKVDHFLWSKSDNIIYGVHDTGYFWWGIQSNFKNRNQSIEEFNFQVKGAFINHKDRLIVYGQHRIIQICDHRISNEVQIQQKLKKMFCQNQYYLMVTEKGQIIKCNHLDIKNNKTSTFTLNIPNKKQHTNQNNNLQIHCIRKNSILCVNQNHDVDILEWGKSDIQKGQIVSIQRKNIIRLYKQYEEYQQKIVKIQQNVKDTIQIMKIQLENRQKIKQQQFKAELLDNQQRYEYVRKQKSRLENTMEENIEVYQKQTLSQVKELQKMYERKIALTTNKLLTSEQINYRNKMLAQQNLKVLQKRTGNDVQKIRQEYTKQLRKYMEEKDLMNDQIYKIKKQYQSRLYDLQQQNQSLLKIYQDKSDEHINILKKNVVGWQIKYSQVISKKDNIQKALSEEMINIQILKERLAYLQVRKKQSDRKSQFLQLQVTKMQRVLEQKNNSISCYQERINDLQKSNQILKYRVVELKNQSQPQQSEIQKLKDSMNQLQEEYDKIVKSSHQKEQMFGILKKQNQKLRQNLQRFDLRVKKVQKSYYQLYDKIMDITKSPIQQIRKQLIELLNESKGDSKNKSISGINGTQNPLGELNRIREHLQVCLHEAVDSNKRGEEQKKVQLLKKNRQNSQLIKQINDLRRRVKILEAQLKQRELQITRLKRGDPILLRASSSQKERQSQQKDYIYSQSAKKTNPTNTHTRLKTQARETKESFFQKSLFKSGSYWKQKRLKTQQGNRRKKSSYQMQRIDRNPSGKRLLIQGNQQVQQYKRLLEQKQTIIKQLINKIQSLS